MGELNIDQLINTIQHVFPNKAERNRRALEQSNVANQQEQARIMANWLKSPEGQQSVVEGLQQLGAQTGLIKAQAGSQNATANMTDEQRRLLPAQWREQQLKNQAEREVNQRTLENQQLSLENQRAATQVGLTQSSNQFDLATQRQNAIDTHNIATEQQSADAIRLRALTELSSDPRNYSVVQDPNNPKQSTMRLNERGQQLQQALDKFLGMSSNPQQTVQPGVVPSASMDAVERAKESLRSKQSAPVGMPASNPYSQPSIFPIPTKPAQTIPATPMTAPPKLSIGPSEMPAQPQMLTPETMPQMRQFSNPALAGLDTNKVLQMIQMLMQQQQG